MTVLFPTAETEMTTTPAEYQHQIHRALTVLEMGEAKAVLQEWEPDSTVLPLIWRETPMSLGDLVYLTPMDKLRSLDSNWDGYGAEPLSAKLIQDSENLWNAIEGRYEQYPKVFPGAGNFILFSWDKSPDKTLFITIYECDGESTFDLLMKLRGKKFSVEGEFDLEDLVNLIDFFQAL